MAEEMKAEEVKELELLIDNFNFYLLNLKILIR